MTLQTPRPTNPALAPWISERCIILASKRARLIDQLARARTFAVAANLQYKITQHESAIVIHARALVSCLAAQSQRRVPD